MRKTHYISYYKQYTALDASALAHAAKSTTILHLAVAKCVYAEYRL